MANPGAQRSQAVDRVSPASDDRIALRGLSFFCKHDTAAAGAVCISLDQMGRRGYAVRGSVRRIVVEVGDEVGVLGGVLNLGGAGASGG